MLTRWTLFASLTGLAAHAQDTQALPEIDAHLTVNSHLRAYLQAQDDREGGDPEQFTFGPSIQLFHKPWLKLKDVTLFDLDDVKSRPFFFETGYRIITAPDTPVKHRSQNSITLHIPIGARLLLIERNQADLNWQSGDLTWRYRNKVTLQRSIAIHTYHLTPYIAAEPFYLSQYSKFATTDLYIGSLLPIGKHVQFDAYYEHENDTGKKPNRQNNYVGLALHLYFTLKSAAHSSQP